MSFINPFRNHEPQTANAPSADAGAGDPGQPPRPPRPPYLPLFCFLFFTYFYFYPSGQHNDNARFDQTRAIVELGVLHIDKFAFNSADVVRKDVPIFAEGTAMWDFMPWRTPPEPVRFEKNRTFPNKAPGTSFFAVPAWWLLRQFFSMFQIPTWLVEHLMPWLTIWLTIGLMTALASLCLYGVLEHMLRSGPVALALTVAWALGSIAFPFSIVNFSHQLAASMLFISFAIVYCYKMNSRVRAAEGKHDEPCCPLPFNSPLWLGLAGFLAGFSLTTEYPTALAVGPLGLYTLIVLVRLPGKKWRWAPLYAAGVIIGGMFLVWYNIKIDGKIFYIPYVEYTHEANHAFKEHKQGFMGVTFFKDAETARLMLSNLEKITFRPQRGLFYCNPWTVFVLLGLGAWTLWRGRRLEGALAAVIVVAFFIFNAGYGRTIVFWGGGWSVGPRHIIPMLPFLTLLVASVARWGAARAVLYPLILVSMGIMLMASAVEPRAPYEYSNPVKDLFFENYMLGRLAYYDFGVFNSIFTTPDSVAFNIGKLIRMKSEYQLLPLFAFWLWMAWLIVWRLRARHAALRERAAAAAVAAAQVELNPQIELMDYMEQTVLGRTAEGEPENHIGTIAPSVAPASSPNPDPPQTDNEPAGDIAHVSMESGDGELDTNIGPDGLPAPSSLPSAEPPAAPASIAPMALSAAMARSWPRIWKAMRRLNDPSRLVYSRFLWPLMFGGFALYVFVMLAIPIEHSWAEDRKLEKGQGLMGQYVRGGLWREKPGIALRSPEIDPTKIVYKKLDELISFNWIESGLPIHGEFCIVWNGFLYVPEDNRWTLATESDDGSMLFLNGRMIVDNWGEHMPMIAQGQTQLSKGFHPITLFYYNKFFGGKIVLKWAPSGAALMTIPTENLFAAKPGSPPPQTPLSEK